MKPDKRTPSHLLFAVFHFGIASLFVYAFYVRFWVWRHEISQVNSSYVTPDGANVTSSGMFWILPAAIFAILGILRTAP